MSPRETSYLILAIAVIISVVIGVLIGYILRKNVGEKTVGSAEQQAKNLLMDAQSRAESIRKEIELEAKEKAQEILI